MKRANKLLKRISKGRGLTDRSLGAERAKADDTLADRKQRVHRSADRAVGRSRDRADLENKQQRGSADRSLTASRSGTASSRAKERKDADRRLEAEREAADRRLARERDQTDIATDRERAATEAAQEDVFKTERMHTDRDLSHEREFVDEESARARQAILEAAAEHSRSLEDLALRDDFLTLLATHLRQPMLQISVAADRLREGSRFKQSDTDDRTQVEAIAKHSQEVLRLVGDLLERVTVWSPSESTARSPGKRQGRSGTARKKASRK